MSGIKRKKKRDKKLGCTPMMGMMWWAGPLKINLTWDTCSIMMDRTLPACCGHLVFGFCFLPPKVTTQVPFIFLLFLCFCCLFNLKVWASVFCGVILTFPLHDGSFRENGCIINRQLQGAGMFFLRFWFRESSLEMKFSDDWKKIQLLKRRRCVDNPAYCTTTSRSSSLR